MAQLGGGSGAPVHRLLEHLTCFPSPARVNRPGNLPHALPRGLGLAQTHLSFDQRTSTVAIGCDLWIIRWKFAQTTVGSHNFARLFMASVPRGARRLAGKRIMSSAAGGRSPAVRWSDEMDSSFDLNGI